jgi:L-methionine (R)-S-oxide reductase
MSTNKSEVYAHVLEELTALLDDERDLVANAANTSALLRERLDEINWVGFYFRRGDELVIGPFQGRPACVRIPLGQGVCGTAAVRHETIVVADVRQFPGHIACDAASRSEIVVPIMVRDLLVGVLDVDSPVRGRFDNADRDGLERIAEAFVRLTDLSAP